MSHKCFISYHADDKKAVDDFCEKFSGTFIHRGIKMEGNYSAPIIKLGFSPSNNKRSASLADVPCLRQVEI